MKRKAFSIIELLIVMGIMLILMSIGLRILPKLRNVEVFDNELIPKVLAVPCANADKSGKFMGVYINGNIATFIEEDLLRDDILLMIPEKKSNYELYGEYDEIVILYDENGHCFPGQALTYNGTVYTSGRVIVGKDRDYHLHKYGGDVTVVEK
jgi:prepilin-type N-terminal cleavage/methylation domain-containing protein